MNKVIHRNKTFYGHTSAIILEDGYAYVLVTIMEGNPEIALVHDLVVHKDRRGEGLGSKLLEEAYEEGKYLGAKVNMLSVVPGSWLEEWYKRHGFRDIGRKETVSGVEHVVLEKPIE